MRHISATNKNPPQGEPSKGIWLFQSLKERGSVAHVTHSIGFCLWKTAFISISLSGEMEKKGKFPDTRVICFVHARRQCPVMRHLFLHVQKSCKSLKHNTGRHSCATGA